MTTIYLIFVAVAIVAVYEFVQFLRKRAEEKKAILAYSIVNAYGNDPLVNPIDSEKSERAQEIVVACEKDLHRQKAGGYGQWLPSLMEGPMYIYYDEKGGMQVKTITRQVTPGIALTAVRMTLNELMGSRFNLDTLLWAEAELEKMGEGE